MPSSSGLGTRETVWNRNPTTGFLESVTVTGAESGVAFAHTTQYTANAGGKPLYVDPAGFTTDDRVELTYDPTRGNGALVLATRTEPLGIGTTTYSQDVFNRPTVVVDPNGLERQTDYDALNRVTRLRLRNTAEPATVLETQSYYTVFGELACTVFPRGNGAHYEYDAMGRLETVSRGTAVGLPSVSGDMPGCEPAAGPGAPRIRPIRQPNASGS